MPEWWYEFSYDPLVASLVSGMVVGLIMAGITAYVTKKSAAHCPYCCPKRNK